jgi:DNA-directed RNA polymerase subunit beta'
VIVPKGKHDELAKADAKIAEMEEQYRDGLITDNEKYQQTVDAWNEATENITKMVEGVLDPYGSIYTIAKSGATKAKFQQIRQLSGMRGLMASPSGKIIDVPIRGNFREGLSVGEYFISSHGARKGLADTALRTAESGYLTRRLIDVSQDVIVTEEDCGTTEGILVTNADSRDMMLPDMRDRLKGRILLEAIPGLDNVEPGDELTEEIVEQIMSMGVEAVRVRSTPAVSPARKVTSPRVCRVLKNSSRRVSRKIRPRSARLMASSKLSKTRPPVSAPCASSRPTSSSTSTPCLKAVRYWSATRSMCRRTR